MSRDAARKLARSPNGDHALVKRNSTGTVQMSTVTSTSVTVSNTGAAAAFATVDAGTPNLVGFTSASIKIAKAAISTMNTNFNLTISRDGSALTSTTVSATGANVTLSTSSTLTTPGNDPSWTFKGNVAGGTLSAVTYIAKRESRWV